MVTNILGPLPRLKKNHGYVPDNSRRRKTTGRYVEVAFSVLLFCVFNRSETTTNPTRPLSNHEHTSHRLMRLYVLLLFYSVVRRRDLVVTAERAYNEYTPVHQKI